MYKEATSSRSGFFIYTNFYELIISHIKTQHRQISPNHYQI